MIGPFRSHGRHVIAASFLAVAVLRLAISSGAMADDPVEIVLALHPARIDPFAALPRLLPADPDLEPGNAAVVLNGLYAERLGVVLSWKENSNEVAVLPVGDPRIGAFSVESMIPDMIRSGRIRDADWNHPVHDDFANVYLGDMQTARRMVSYELTIWIKQKLAEHNLTAAEEGIRTQLACARHIGNTPFLLTGLYAQSAGRLALDNLEYLVAEPGCPNYRWSLSVLPPLLFDAPRALEWEARRLTLSLPMAKEGLPADHDVASWQQLTAEYFELTDDPKKPLSAAQRADLIARLAAYGREELVRRDVVSADAAEALPPEAAVMLLLLTQFAEVGRKTRSAWSLPPERAIRELRSIDHHVAEIASRVDGRSFFGESNLHSYLFSQSFSRRTAMLETVESLRHHAATHDGHLPATLADLEYAARPDPVAGEPFTYVRGDKPTTASLSMPDIPGVPDDAQQRRTYKIEMVSP